MQNRFADSVDAPVAEAEAQAPTCAEGRKILFTTSTCPKCVMAKKFLEDAGIAYEVVVVNENPDAARTLGIKQAPTLVILEGDTVVQKIENPSNIRAYAENYQA